MGVCTEPDKVALVMEYVDGKSLDRMLHEEKVPLTLHQKFQLAKDIAKGAPSSRLALSSASHTWRMRSHGGL